MSRGYAAVGLWRPKCDANVGGVMRAVMCYDAALVAIAGGRYRRAATDTTCAWRHVPVMHTDNLRDAVPLGCVPVAIEIVDGARSLVEYTHPERAFYVFGPENGSLDATILAWCRDVVRVPTAFCMNLAATVNVVLYDRLAKRGQRERRLGAVA